MITLRSYVQGRWVEGEPGKRPTLVNPATEETVAEAGTEGIDFEGALRHAREVGGPALREMSFAERGEIVRGLSKIIHDNREALIEPEIENGGATRSDAKFDVDGASGTLAAYGHVAKALPGEGAGTLLADGEPVQLTRSARYFGQHVLVPRRGVAVHVNAFNFPAWGMAEKAAVALLAGMPVIAKPATSTALTAYRLAELIIESKLLPEGAFSFVAGSTGDLLHQLGGQDVLAFTGSLATAIKLRSMENIIAGSVSVNVEADSLNGAVLGADVEPGSATWDLFVADVIKEMTQKTGQKCTAMRRILVPENLLEFVEEALSDRLGAIKVGNPALEEVRMGPVATAGQLRDVRAGIEKLLGEADAVFGGSAAVQGIGVDAGKGYFVSPVLLRAREPAKAKAVHGHEVFGPVATLLPYDGSAAVATDLIARGSGMLVTSVYSDDKSFLKEAVAGLAPWNGRLYIGSAKIAGQAVPPGMVMPQLVHGGPGRAGGGEELGGPRGLSLYMQRTALQGDKALLERIARG